MKNKSKVRVMFGGETNVLSTGFAVMAKEILTRLNNTGKYEISELGCYMSPGDPREVNIPWKFYNAIPDPNDQEGINKYNSDVHGQFGSIMFEKACLDFGTQIFCQFTDAWMSTEWVLKSPFRKYLKYIVGPTVDGSPQKPEWIDDYLNTDLVLTYSNYGKRILEEESGGRIKVFGIFAPGVDETVFKPLNKQELRQKYGIPQNAYVIMKNSRNQARKKFPELIDMFGKLLAKYKRDGDKDLYENSYLLLHTSNPDVGYNIGKFILQSSISNRILVSYSCRNCHENYVDRFQGELTNCKFCGTLAAHMPNSSNGIPTEKLVEVYNLADLYIQYSTAEGFSMTPAEAKACGVPTCGSDHSAISEQINAPGCFPLKNKTIFYETVMETEQVRFLPDNDDAIDKISKFFKLPKEKRVEMGLAARKHVIETASFDRCAKIWETAIDSIEPMDEANAWLNPKGTFAPMNYQFGPTKSSSDFVDKCIVEILGRPELLTSYWRNEIVKSLNVGYNIGRQGRDNFDTRKCVGMMLKMGQEQNYWENERLKRLNISANKEFGYELV